MYPAVVTAYYFVQAAIGRATSLEEVARLEAALKEGKAPSDLFGKCK